MNSVPDMKYRVIRRAFQTLKDTDQGLHVRKQDMTWREYKVFQLLQPYYQKMKHSVSKGDMHGM